MGCHSNARFMVGIAGVPGSGKSTTAKAVCAKINSMRPRLDKHNVAVVVGMDGELYPACNVIHPYKGLVLILYAQVDAICDIGHNVFETLLSCS